MTSFGYLVGSFYGYPTAYLHEGSQQYWHLSPLPIDIDPEFFKNNISFLRRLMNEGLVEMDTLSWGIKMISRKRFSFY